MSFIPNLFTSQYHKTRGGYYINHDMLMSASSATRNKLIFYYIAENVPQKMSENDRREYKAERDSRVNGSIALWTYASFFGILIPAAARIYKQKRITFVKDLGIWTFLSFAGASLTNSILWRTNEARMVESSELMDRLTDKYQFGIYDFALARKEAHVKKILETYDHNRSINLDEHDRE